LPVCDQSSILVRVYFGIFVVAINEFQLQLLILFMDSSSSLKTGAGIVVAQIVVVVYDGVGFNFYFQSGLRCRCHGFCGPGLVSQCAISVFSQFILDYSLLLLMDFNCQF
jgi:hypothetical protein